MAFRIKLRSSSADFAISIRGQPFQLAVGRGGRVTFLVGTLIELGRRRRLNENLAKGLLRHSRRALLPLQ
jgi:hypothetical protein